ncbi:MAG: hypothetical protein JRH16_18665 [Deltaproteobacteria bacterium]|nr:hypothetical protein [Deltaproteobacteria bacterium]MBW2362326.1 hypothetical protein [Deltaproteobacteria bacterium]
MDLEYAIEAHYLDVVAAFADIARYPEFTEGRAQRGEIHRSEARTDARGNRVVEVSYSVWAAGSENTGERVYTYFADRPYATIDLEFHTALVREDTHILWAFEEVDGTTRIEGHGTRTAPWLLSLFSFYHSQQALLVFEKIGRELTARETAGPAPSS